MFLFGLYALLVLTTSATEGADHLKPPPNPQVTSPDPLPSLDTLHNLIASDLDRVNQLIIDKMDSQILLIPQLAGHVIAAGGKRIRPALTLASAQISGYQGNRHIALAACVEFIHTATLLHDDIVDNSKLRRGQASANALWGNEAPVLVGDFLFSRAFQLMVGDGNLKVLKILSDAAAIIAEGEIMQLLSRNDDTITEITCLETAQAKTAALFAAATRVGAVLGEQPQHCEDALGKFGLDLGIAFQLVDDALDYRADREALGKTIGDDFREGKVSLPVALAIKEASEEERAFWHRTLVDLDQEDGDFERAREILERSGALSATIERAGHYSALACQALEILPASLARDALAETASFAVARAY